ncbi:PEP/pyruvate-binding domain-containing protein [Streptomyces sp. NPDC054975]
MEGCWASLHSERATASREANDIPHDGVRMAVVVQRMVDADVAGVLFTANPLTGSRGASVVDAAPGLGTAVVDGTAAADHYVLDGTQDGERGCLTVGAELHAKGLVDRPDDVMFLELPELREVVASEIDLRDTIATRRAEYARELRRRTVPVALLSDGTDVETLLPAEPSDGRSLTGMGAAPGRVTGRARVVRNPSDASIEPGDILVAPTTDPGWTPLFLTAGGLVTETGAVMAHGPTVAREYGIPAVICVPNATTRIADGQLITVDGATGTVTLEG